MNIFAVFLAVPPKIMRDQSRQILLVLAQRRDIEMLRFKQGEKIWEQFSGAFEVVDGKIADKDNS